MGKASGTRPWVIIACFEHFKQKVMTKSRGSELRNTDFGINDFFPPWRSMKGEKKCIPS
jgi:hypothetical protein